MIQVLSELVRQIRGHTLRLLETEDAQWQLWAPAGTSNHFIWNAGHIFWGWDLIGIQALGRPSELPKEWEEIFGWKCRPLSETSQWPTVTELRELLSYQKDCLLELIVESNEVLSSQAKPAVDTGWPLLEGLVHACHDEARHQGEMYLLYKMTRSKREKS